MKQRQLMNYNKGRALEDAYITSLTEFLRDDTDKCKQALEDDITSVTGMVWRRKNGTEKDAPDRDRGF